MEYFDGICNDESCDIYMVTYLCLSDSVANAETQRLSTKLLRYTSLVEPPHIIFGIVLSSFYFTVPMKYHITS